MGTGILILAAIWGGFCWVLRGGLFGKLCRKWFEFEPGTTYTRIASAFLFALPFAGASPILALCWPSIYVAMTIGYFGEAMGQQRQPRDALLMSAWGFVVFLLALAPTAFLAPSRPILALTGLCVGPVYALNHRIGNKWGTDWTQRAEFMTGVAVALAIALSAH